MTQHSVMDRNLALEAVRVTEAAALAASRLMGRGDEKAADQAAVNAMRMTLGSIAIDGTVRIGEGERDKAPMLYIGERVGSGGPPIDIALDPLEGTTITAKGGPNALAVLAMAQDGGFLNAPDTYMDKIAVGSGLPEDVVDLDEEPKVNLANLAKAKSMDVSDVVVCILDRPRHAELIAKVPSTSIGAVAARRRGCWRRRRCAASADSSKAVCCSATTTSGPGRPAAGSPISIASTRSTNWRAAMSCSPPPA